MTVWHDDPFTSVDRHPERKESPGESPGISRLYAPIPDEWVPQSSHAARLRVGARNLDQAQWVSARDSDWPATLAMKRVLVGERPTEVAAFLPGAEEACDEVAAGVLSSVGESPGHESGHDALIDAALRVADDLCVLQDDGNGTPRLTAAVLCSPNRWLLSEKIGGSMASIHGPVARYDSELQSPVDAMLARLVPSRPVWRINWGITNHPSLFQPWIPPHTPEMDPGEMWLRVEWQTLRRLPVTGAVLFGIRTHLQTLAEFRRTRRPELIDDFADLILKLPEDVAAYKSIAPYRDSLHAYLAQR